MKTIYLFIVLLFLSACNSESKSENNETSDDTTNVIAAHVVEVATQEVGTNGSNYRFDVTLRSNETGCDQYADWWEVLDTDGVLIYRRVLGHSHPNEQPFTRSGGPVDIQAGDLVYIRAHMNSHGYGGDVFEGTVNNGFKKSDNPPEFLPDVENQDPLPNGCAF